MTSGGRCDTAPNRVDPAKSSWPASRQLYQWPCGPYKGLHLDAPVPHKTAVKAAEQSSFPMLLSKRAPGSTPLGAPSGSLPQRAGLLARASVHPVSPHSCMHMKYELSSPKCSNAELDVTVKESPLLIPPISYSLNGFKMLSAKSSTVPQSGTPALSRCAWASSGSCQDNYFSQLISSNI